MSSPSLKLVIGNKNYSSWSLRAWLCLRESGLEFEEIRLPLFTDSWRREIGRYSPAGRVPVLIDGETTVWDSTAIYEHLLERHPGALGWPSEQPARAHARSVAAEMHSGFLAVREELPQNLRLRRRRPLAELSEPARKQLERILAIWTDCRRRYSGEGDWLFGRLSLADVVYAPVALRLVTYEIPVDGEAASFVDAVVSNRHVQEWVRAAKEESETIPFIDELSPASSTPMTLG